MKLFDWLKPRPRAAPAEAAPREPAPEETQLAARIGRARDGVPLSADDWSALDRLVTQGREHQVIELLRDFIAAQPSDLDATLRLCELLCGRLEHAAARPLLERLVDAPRQRGRALLLLGEAAERAGELEAARKAYERLLAYELDHPRARAAAERLRPGDRRRDRGNASLPTLEGPGQVTAPVGGRYRLIDELGRGASGTVYLAEDLEIGREVALKLLHPRARGAGDPNDTMLRAWEEARVSASLRHPGIAAIYDLDEERQIIAMELCRGGSLRERLLAGPLRPDEALRGLSQLALALAAAHERGVIHGDVKPANLLLRRSLALGADPLDEDELVLCDFGVGRLSDDSAPAVEQRAMRGTLVYMAPELRRGHLSAAADLYAAGIVALELLGGPAGLAPWLADRAALLRGEVRPDGRVSQSAALGRLRPEVEALVADLLQVDELQRPRALEVATRARALATRLAGDVL